jgi:hypothetical protein
VTLSADDDGDLVTFLEELHDALIDGEVEYLAIVSKRRDQAPRMDSLETPMAYEDRRRLLTNLDEYETVKQADCNGANN